MWLADGLPSAQPGIGLAQEAHGCFSVFCRDWLPGRWFLVFFRVCPSQVQGTAALTSALASPTIRNSLAYPRGLQRAP